MPPPPSGITSNRSQGSPPGSQGVVEGACALAGREHGNPRAVVVLQQRDVGGAAQRRRHRVDVRQGARRAVHAERRGVAGRGVQERTVGRQLEEALPPHAIRHVV